MKKIIYSAAALVVSILCILTINYLLEVFQIRTNVLNNPLADEQVTCMQGQGVTMRFVDCQLRVIVPEQRSKMTASLVIRPHRLLFSMYAAAGMLAGSFYYLLLLYVPTRRDVMASRLQNELVAGQFILRIIVSGVAGLISYWLVAGGFVAVAALTELDPANADSGYQWALIVPIASGLFLSAFLERIENVIKSKQNNNNDNS